MSRRYPFAVKTKRDVPFQYWFDPELQTIENRINNSVKGRDHEQIWSAIHELASLTKKKGHCPYKDYLKDLAYRKL